MEEQLVDASTERLHGMRREMNEHARVTSHLREHDADIGVAPGRADGVLRGPTPKRERDLIGRCVDDAVGLTLEPHITRDLGHASPAKEEIIVVGRFEICDVGGPALF
jgi:hypothetical protein